MARIGLDPEVREKIRDLAATKLLLEIDSPDHWSSDDCLNFLYLVKWMSALYHNSEVFVAGFESNF